MIGAKRRDKGATGRVLHEFCWQQGIAQHLANQGAAKQQRLPGGGGWRQPPQQCFTLMDARQALAISGGERLDVPKRRETGDLPGREAGRQKNLSPLPQPQQL